MQKTCKNHPKNDQKTHQKSSKNTPKKHTEKLTTQFQPKVREMLPKGAQKTTDKGGKGRDPGWNPPRKKKNIAKRGTRKTLTKPNTLRGGLRPARGRISVACGNSSAPGPREDSLHAKICKKFNTRVNAGVFFYKFLP